MLSRFVRRGAHHASSFRRSADEQQGSAAGTLRIHESRDGDEERVGVDEQDPPNRCLFGHTEL